MNGQFGLRERVSSIVRRVWRGGVIAMLACLPLAATADVVVSQPTALWNLVWEDEFNGTTVNSQNWTYDLGAGGWGNNELQTYDTASATVQNGELLITARKNANGSYSSARLKTQGLKSWTYGRVAARMRLPRGQGIWPAFWMLGTNITSVGWPKCGEIDIMEMIGGGEDRDDSVYGTIHWDNNGHAATGSSRIELADPEIFHDDYYVFDVEWSPTAIVWHIDGVETARVSIDRTALPDREEFHSPFFIVLNLAVGGSWPGSPDATTEFPQVLAVDWVRVYQRVSAPEITGQPTTVSVAAGGAATFSVTVAGEPAPTLQWQRDGVAIAGATSATFRIGSVTAADAGNYRVIATNTYGTATSNAVALTVTTATPAPSPTTGGGGGGGGGGAPSVWFALAVMALVWRRVDSTQLKSRANKS